MVIIETHPFTNRISKLLSGEEYRLLQRDLVVRPETGKIIQGSGGIRKIRWAYEGRGKRGGVRVFYFWHEKKDIILMLFIFAKNEQSDLSHAQLKQLKNIVVEEFK